MFSNFADRNWVKNLLKMNIEKILNVEIHANSATIVFFAVGFGISIFLLFGALCVFTGFSVKMVARVKDMEKGKTGAFVPMAQMAPMTPIASMPTMSPRPPWAMEWPTWET